MQINTTTKTYLIYYFNGELDSIIERLRKRKNQKFTDDYYCTLNSIQMRPAMSTNRTGTADLTALRAVTLADMSLTSKRYYNRYSGLKKDIKKQLKKYNQEELTLLKSALGIGCTQTEAIQAASFSTYKAKQKINKILNEFDDIIRGVFYESE
jgi:hypothetical protein